VADLVRTTRPQERFARAPRRPARPRRPHDPDPRSRPGEGRLRHRADRLGNDAGKPFGPDSLLEIAEIGLATADVDATRAAIQEALRADILWGGRPGWQLTAIGDDDGVVIVAPTGSGWIPVGLPARPFPTTIVAAAPKPREQAPKAGCRLARVGTSLSRAPRRIARSLRSAAIAAWPWYS
jgi:hypothetical protein